MYHACLAFSYGYYNSDPGSASAFAYAGDPNGALASGFNAFNQNHQSLDPNNQNELIQMLSNAVDQNTRNTGCYVYNATSTASGPVGRITKFLGVPNPIQYITKVDFLFAPLCVGKDF